MAESRRLTLPLSPVLRVIPNCALRFDGWVGQYIDNITDHWLKVAPLANPGMLDMMRQRDHKPLRAHWAHEGEYPGKFLTGAVEMLRTTGDAELRRVLARFVKTLVSFQAKDGYLGPWPKGARLTGQAPNTRFAKAMTMHYAPGVTWDLWGHYHVMVALLRWHAQTADRKALAAVRKIGDMLCRRYLNSKRCIINEHHPINLVVIHGLTMLYRVTGVARYEKLATKITDDFSETSPRGGSGGDYIEAALAGKQLHETGNTRWEMLHVLMGIGDLYWCTGDERYRRVFEHLWWGITRFDRHNNGAFSTGECASGNPYDKGKIETCCVIAWAAMSVQMLAMTGNSIVADELELTTLNAVAGLFSCSGRWVTYDTPMDGVRELWKKTYNWQAVQGTPEINCCSANAARGFGVLGDWAIMQDDEGLVLNYYGPSEFSAKPRRGVNVTLTQETDYPCTGRITLHVAPSRPVEFNLKLRIPHWSCNTSVAVNGRKVKHVRPGQYLSLDRRWKRGDRIELRLDMSPHFWVGKKQCRGKVSMYRGPILMTYDPRFNDDDANAKPVVTTAQDRAMSIETALREMKPAQREAAHNALQRRLQRGDRTGADYPFVTNRISVLDASNLKGRRVSSRHWLPPAVLVEYTAPSSGGKKVRLCDYASAGETGIPYRSWLDIKGIASTPYSRSNPLRSGRP